MTLLSLYPKCKKCGSTDRKVYQVGVVLEEKSEYVGFISMYRCYCAFCDGCLEDVKARNPGNVYIPLTDAGKMPGPSAFLDDLYIFYGAVIKACTEKDVPLRDTIDAKKIATGVIGDRYHETLRKFHAKIASEYTGETKTEKDRMFRVAVDAMNPANEMYQQWLLATYHDNKAPAKA
jgi:hypothetical protein